MGQRSRDERQRQLHGLAGEAEMTKNPLTAAAKKRALAAAAKAEAMEKLKGKGGKKMPPWMAHAKGEKK
jgi:hypothetical protein